MGKTARKYEGIQATVAWLLLEIVGNKCIIISWKRILMAGFLYWRELKSRFLEVTDVVFVLFCFDGGSSAEEIGRLSDSLTPYRFYT